MYLNAAGTTSAVIVRYYWEMFGVYIYTYDTNALYFGLHKLTEWGLISTMHSKDKHGPFVVTSNSCGNMVVVHA